jgi:uncharacterized protein YyaL (SSP411 family)
MLACASALLALTPAPAAPSRHEEPSAPAAQAPRDDRAQFEHLAARVTASWDSARGGFVSKDGEPSESAVELGLLLGHEREGGEWKRRALATIDWTRGLMDTLSGGFASRRPRGGEDLDAFTMRTDVNARRLANLVAAWRTTGDERYRRDAGGVAGFVDRQLIDGRGGFVAAPVGDRTLDPAANGLAIHAWLTWAAANGDPATRDFALRSIERVWQTCFDPRGVLLRRGDFGEVLMPPQLVDQVEMGRALLLSATLCGRPQDLKRAGMLARVMVEKFVDPKRGAFMTQAWPKKDGSIRRAPCRAAENARAALFLAELAAATGIDAARDAARRAWAAFAEDQDEKGFDGADWALAFRSLYAPTNPPHPTWQAAAEASAPGPNILYRARGKRR